MTIILVYWNKKQYDAYTCICTGIGKHENRKEKKNKRENVYMK